MGPVSLSLVNVNGHSSNKICLQVWKIFRKPEQYTISPGDAEAIAWAFQKNDTETLAFYKMKY